jgi:hypothetical protein
VLYCGTSPLCSITLPVVTLPMSKVTNAAVMPKLRATGSAAGNIVVACPAATERRPAVLADVTTRLT